MQSNGLWVLVEGPDDDRFFQNVIRPRINGYEWITSYQYAVKSKKQVCAFIRNLDPMNADYLIFADIDLFPCITERKNQLCTAYTEVSLERIIVVCKEIESWYLAGIDEQSRQLWRIPVFNTTDKISKEQFRDVIPKKFSSRIDFMQEVMKVYSVDTACRHNDSFAYFARRFGFN